MLKLDRRVGLRRPGRCTNWFAVAVLIAAAGVLRAGLFAPAMLLLLEDRLLPTLERLLVLELRLRLRLQKLLLLLLELLDAELELLPGLLSTTWDGERDRDFDLGLTLAAEAGVLGRETGRNRLAGSWCKGPLLGSLPRCSKGASRT